MIFLQIVYKSDSYNNNIRCPVLMAKLTGQNIFPIKWISLGRLKSEAAIMFKWKALIFSTLIPLIVYSSLTNAASELFVPLSKRVKQSDAVVVGYIESIQTFNISEIDKIRKLEDVDLYSVVTLRNSSTVESFGLSPVDGLVKIYVDGGAIPMPRVLSSRYKGKYLIQGNTALPNLRVNTEELQLLFLVGNGMYEVPFVSVSSSVLTLRNNGIVADDAGRVLASIQDDDFSPIFQVTSLSKPDYAEGPLPPADAVVESNTGKFSPLMIDDLFSYISSNVSEARNVQEVHRNLVSPVLIGPAFKEWK